MGWRAARPARVLPSIQPRIDELAHSAFGFTFGRVRDQPLAHCCELLANIHGWVGRFPFSHVRRGDRVITIRNSRQSDHGVRSGYFRLRAK